MQFESFHWLSHHQGRKHFAGLVNNLVNNKLFLPTLEKTIIVFSSVGKKSFIQPHLWKALCKATSYNIVLFETAEHIFADE